MAEDPRVSFRDKEAHDRWIKKLVERTANKHGAEYKPRNEDNKEAEEPHKPVNRIKFSEN